MAGRLSDKQNESLLNLLALLRQDIKKFPPVFYCEFEGIEASDNETASILARGFCHPGQRFFHYWGPNPPTTAVLFGNENVDKGIARLSEIAPKILDTVILFTPVDGLDALSSCKTGDWRQGLMAAKLILSAVERVRDFEPESLSLPNSMQGKLDAEQDEHTNAPAIVFPNGEFSSADIYHFDKWHKVHQFIKSNAVSMSLLQTPLVQSCALIAKFALDRIGREGTPNTPQKQIEKKQTLYDSGHKENEGEWCDAMPLSWMARAIKQSEETTKAILSNDGLKQKTREKWIARIDTLKTDWTDAIIDGQQIKRISRLTHPHSPLLAPTSPHIAYVLISLRSKG